MDKNIIVRRLQSARHLLSGDDSRIDLDCVHLALGNIDDALEELQKGASPTPRFIEAVTYSRDRVSIPVADIVAVYDYQCDNSRVITRDNNSYYCELSRKQVVELINRQ